MIAVLDIGKTNKKCLVFDDAGQVVYEQSTTLPETVDDDGFPCEDLALLSAWVTTSIQHLAEKRQFPIRYVNCTTYGASFVHLNAAGQPITPLYNYLKPFPDDLLTHFFDTYGPADTIARETASPVLGMLNSGLQIYWLKHRKPHLFSQVSQSLHLPQYIATLLGYPPATEMTSIGCHTMLWNYQQRDYHRWVKAEQLYRLFPAIVPAVSRIEGQKWQVGTGLHDSSAALIPYLRRATEPFVLLSTGTWCISLNPFNDEPLTDAEFEQDCLCYLTYEGKPVKAARYFGGNEHEQFVKNLAERHNLDPHFYQQIGVADLTTSEPFVAEYVVFMQELVQKQAISTRLAIGGTNIKKLYIDGGFSRNALYMHFLAEAFPDMTLETAEVPQATALGATMI